MIFNDLERIVNKVQLKGHRFEVKRSLELTAPSAHNPLGGVIEVKCYMKCDDPFLKESFEGMAKDYINETLIDNMDPVDFLRILQGVALKLHLENITANFFYDEKPIFLSSLLNAEEEIPVIDEKPASPSIILPGV